MPSIDIFSKCTTIKYKSTLCSKATFFVLLTTLLTILLPFFIAYASNDFWLKRASFYEQPNIQYKHEYVFMAETNERNSPILCSNIVDFQTENNFDKCSKITVREIDNNEDGQYDQIHFNLTVNNIDNFNIQSLNLILTFDYKIHTVCSMQMQTAILIQLFFNQPIIKTTFIGDVAIKQRFPLICKSQKKINTYNYSLLHPDKNFELLDFIKDLHERNVTIRAENIYTSSVSGIGSSYHLDIQLIYPEHKIYYKPNFWQIMKFAWIQYYSLFGLIAWIIYKIQNYVFTNKLVLYYSNKKLN